MQNKRKPRILVTNDDGVESANIHALAKALAPYGEVFVFAPESEQSGVGHAFTIRRSLSVKELKARVFDEKIAYRVFSVSGTPSDASKFALGHFAGVFFGEDASALNGEPSKDIHGNSTFDVVFSGVNVGENSGVSSHYSGTVAGAREGALWGVPSIAISLSVGGESLLPRALEFAQRIVCEGLYRKMPPHTLWNVNFPKSADGTFAGFKAAKMSLEMFTDHYDRISDGDCRWQLDGVKLWNKAPIDSDDYLLDSGFATITPQTIDVTDLKSLEIISEIVEVN